MHNSEENKQADENMGSSREKKRRETISEGIYGCLQKDTQGQRQTELKLMKN